MLTVDYKQEFTKPKLWKKHENHISAYKNFIDNDITSWYVGEPSGPEAALRTQDPLQETIPGDVTCWDDFFYKV